MFSINGSPWYMDLGTPMPRHLAPKDDPGCPKGTVKTALLIALVVVSDTIVTISRKVKSIFRK